jgi:hypothetical protein
MLALTWGGRRYPWLSPELTGLLLGSAVLWVLFAVRVMTALEPFIPLSVLRDGAVRVGTVGGCFAVGTVIAITVILPLYAQVVLGMSVTESAISIVALQGAATTTSIIGGRLLVSFAHYKRVPLAGLILSIAALIPLAIAPAAFSPLVTFALIAGVGFGLGPMFSFTVVVVQNAVALHQLGIATGTMNFFRALGATFIVSIYSALILAGGPLIRGASTSGALANSNAVEGFRLVFAATILCLAVALASIIVFKERPLRGASSFGRAD